MRVQADNEPMTPSGRKRLLWIVEWLSKGSWAVLDQALYALSQFLVNLLLARWLTPAEYGVYALLYSVLLLRGERSQRGDHRADVGVCRYALR